MGADSSERKAEKISCEMEELEAPRERREVRVWGSLGAFLRKALERGRVSSVYNCVSKERWKG